MALCWKGNVRGLVYELASVDRDLCVGLAGSVVLGENLVPSTYDLAEILCLRVGAQLLE